MELLNERPLEKINVSDITDKCGLTRNTFYYHFHDVYELLAYTFTSETETLLRKYQANQDWQGGFSQGLNFLYENRNMVKNVYHSINKEELYGYLIQVAHKHALVIVSIECSKRGAISGDVKNLVADLYKNAIIGSLISWISTDMQETPESLAKLYQQMFIGTIDSAIESAEKCV